MSFLECSEDIENKQIIIILIVVVLSGIAICII